ncbi:MAG: hypothetical protein MSQ05_06630 [Akkermansia sp.]|nr:hypothetical protein [Akkermansia sp.]
MELHTSSLRIRKSWVIFLSLLYLALPNIIMMMAWVKPVPACLIVAGIIMSLIYYAVAELKSEPGRYIPLNCRNSRLLLYVAFLLAMPFVHDGLIGLFETGWDYRISRQAYFSNLVDAPFPVIYPDGSTMTYYNGTYMVPVVVSRLLGLHPSDGDMIPQYILLGWLMLGMMLAFLLVFVHRRRVSLLCVFLALFLADPLMVWWGTECGKMVVGDFTNYISNILDVDCWALNSHVSRYSLFSLTNVAGCYTSNVPAILAIALITNVRRGQNFVVPFTLAMLFFSSPLGALGCIPFALFAYDFRSILNIRDVLFSSLFVLLPILMLIVAAVYYSRADVFYSSDNGTVSLSTVYSMHGFKGMLFVFLGVLVPSMLLYYPLRKHLCRSRNIKLSLISLIIFSQIWFGGAIFQLNELWLKTCLIYTFVLAVYTAYLWPKLGRDKYIPMVVSIGIMIAYIFSFVSRYTGQDYVEDDCNGHLYHERNGSLEPRRDLIGDLLYTEPGESEKHFPSSILPKGRGCDYSRPLLKPVKPNHGQQK